MELRLLLFLFLSLFFIFTKLLESRHPNTIKTEGPVYYYELLFLYDTSRTAEQKELVIHPFYSHYTNQERAYRFRSFLYPVFYSHGTNYWHTWTFLYLFSKDEKYSQTEKNEGEIVLTPLFYWGYGDSPKERFFSFFPFFGTIKDKLSWEEVSYFMFPLYVSWEYRKYRGYSFLWPLFLWGGDGVNRKDFRFLPFYSHKIHEGKYKHYTFLWPFFQWGRDDLDRKEYRSCFFFFFFLCQKYSREGTIKAYSILYPFSLVAWGKDTKANSFDFKLFWVLFQYSRSETPYLRRLVLFPFYVFQRSGLADIDYYKEMKFYLILFGYLKTESSLVNSRYDFFLPFWYHHYRYYRQEMMETTHWKLWPIISYWNDEVSRGWRVLALWPFPDDYFEKIWSSLYSIVEFQTYSNGDKYFSMLLRIMSFRWNDEREDRNLFFLGFHYKKNPFLWKLTFLGGLFGFSKEVYAKKEGVPLYYYPKYGNLLSGEEKETRYYFHILWFRI